MALYQFAGWSGMDSELTSSACGSACGSEGEKVSVACGSACGSEGGSACGSK